MDHSLFDYEPLKLIEQLSSKTVGDQDLMIVTVSICFEYTYIHTYVTLL